MTLKKNYSEKIRGLAPLLVLVGLVLGIGALRPGFLNWDSLVVTVSRGVVEVSSGAPAAMNAS